jgi:hypothetical protein
MHIKSAPNLKFEVGRWDIGNAMVGFAFPLKPLDGSPFGSISALHDSSCRKHFNSLDVYIGSILLDGL